MDHDYNFLSAIVRGRSERLRTDAGRLHKTANEPFAALLHEILARVNRVVDQLPRDYDLDDPEETAYAVQRLHGLRIELDATHSLMAEYGGDLDRRPPVGLTHLVTDTVLRVVSGPLNIPVVPLIHLDNLPRYSTLDLIDDAYPLLVGEDDDPDDDPDTSSGAAVRRGVPRRESPDTPVPPEGLSASAIRWHEVRDRLPGKPLAMNVPLLDPANAFLAPILAHEVAHVAADHGLLLRVTARLDQAALDSLAQEHLAPHGSPGEMDARQGRARMYLDEWLAEEVCDAVACALAGPSFLFAAAAYLPATRPGELCGHPFPADRLRWAIHFLDRLGWTPWLETQVPDVLAFLRAASVADVADPRGGYPAYLREAVQTQLDGVLDVVLGHLADPLTPDGYAAADTQHDLVASLALGYVPARLEVQAPRLWDVLLAAWSALLAADPQPATIAVAIADADLNRFLIKTLELVGITGLWEQANDNSVA